MNLHPLGKTGLSVSEVGFGCWQLGGAGWGPVDAEDVQAAIEKALDLGVNLFDTAPVYGFGRSEELLGKALKRAGRDVIVVSKGGLVWNERRDVAHDNSPQSISSGLEASLRRLRRDVLDVLILHWPDPAVPLEDAVEALAALRRAGKIRAWGLSNFPSRAVLGLEEQRLFEPSGPVLEYPSNLLDQYAAEYREAGRDGGALRALARMKGLGFLAFDVLARGLLGGRYGEATRFGKRDLRSRDRRYSTGAFEENLARVSQFAALAREVAVPPAALAIRGVLDLPGTTSCLVGVKSSRQVEECALASELHLQRDIRDRLSTL